jgi:outer membrane receptor protein involved in Fe transport
VTVRGMELEYSQSLSFLPAPFKGLNVRASYTRSYASIRRVNMIPHSVNAGLSYANRWFNAYANLNWRDNFPTNISAATPRFQLHRANVDIGGGYRLSSRYQLFFSARNIFNVPYHVMEQVGSNAPVVQFFERNSTNWTFGVKSTW